MTNEKQHVHYGEKMIKVVIRFFTSDMPAGTDLKTAWVGGTVHTTKNEYRGIEASGEFFHTLEEIMPKIQKMLDAQGIKLVQKPTRDKLIQKKLA